MRRVIRRFSIPIVGTGAAGAAFGLRTTGLAFGTVVGGMALICLVSLAATDHAAPRRRDPVEQALPGASESSRRLLNRSPR